VEVRVHGKNMRVADDIGELARDKIAHAGRIFDDGAVADVEIAERRNPKAAGERYRVEITTHTAGHTVRVEARAADERSALDLAIDKFERQLRRLKERLIQRSRKRGDKTLNSAPPSSDEDEDAGQPHIVRRKRFVMRPMSPEEAVLQMEMLEHDFFFFLDAETGQHSVLYHRDDGSLGLIEPA